MQGFEGFLLKKWSKKGGRFLDSLTFRSLVLPPMRLRIFGGSSRLLLYSRLFFTNKLKIKL